MIRCIVCTSSDAREKKTCSVKVSSGGHYRGRWSNLLEAGRGKGDIGAGMTRWDEMGGMVTMIYTQNLDVHSIPFLHSGLLNLDSTKMWISNTDV